ncbi:MAG: hypothetical protein V4562_11435 [Pseudomonadota bacterium]
MSPFVRRTALLLAALCLQACSPAFNWREVRMDNAPLVALLPCKPDKGAKTLSLGGVPTELQMQGCEAGGGLFTVAAARLQPPVDIEQTLRQWKIALLANARTTTSQDQNFAPPGAVPVPASVLATFNGQRADGSPVWGQVALFAQGDQIFQAAVFADKPLAEPATTFFSSLRLR